MKTALSAAAALLVVVGTLTVIHRHPTTGQAQVDAKCVVAPARNVKTVTTYYIEDFASDDGEKLLGAGWMWMNPDDPRNPYHTGLFYTTSPEVARK